MRKFLAQYWFLFALVLLLAGGTIGHRPLAPLAQWTALRNVNMALVLFLMAVPLEFRALWNTLRRPAAPLLATAVSYGLAPLLAMFIAPWLGPEYGPGLLVAAATPCTMASAAVWTRRSGGNDAVALVVTAITNFCCFAVTPTLLVWTAGEIARQAQIDATTLMRELVWLVVMPILLGQLVRSIPAIAQGASKHKLMLGTLAQCGILLMVFLAAIKTGGRLAGSPQSAAGTLEFAVMIASVSGLHLALFFAGMSVARWLRLPREDQLAVGFCGSQKTLMVGLKVADDCGFSILPMICYHVLQLFIDTLLAERLRPQNNGRDKAD